jgi:hypothetical protein
LPNSRDLASEKDRKRARDELLKGAAHSLLLTMSQRGIIFLAVYLSWCAHVCTATDIGRDDDDYYGSNMTYINGWPECTEPMYTDQGYIDANAVLYSCSNNMVRYISHYSFPTRKKQFVPLYGFRF